MLSRRWPRPMPGAVVIAGRVRPAVRDRVGHRLEHVAIDRAQRVVVEPSGNAAHVRRPPPPRAWLPADTRVLQSRQIEILERRDHPFERVALLHLFARRTPDRSARGRVSRSSDSKRRRERLRIVGRHEQAGAAVVDQIEQAADAAGDDRQARRHRFDRAVGKRLGPRRQHERVGRGEQRRHVLAMPEELDAVPARPRARDQRFELAARGPSPAIWNCRSG